MRNCSENLRTFMRERDLTQSALARIAGVSEGTVSLWLSNGRRPKTDALERIADYFSVSVDSLLGRDVDAYRSRISTEWHPGVTVPIRVVGAAHAGEPDIPWELAGDAPLLESIASKHPSCFALEVNGSCMDKLFTSSDYIFVDPDATPKDGSIAVIDVDGATVVRRVKMGNGSMMLVAESSRPDEYPDIVLKDGAVRAVGCVFWWQSKAEIF